MSDKYLNGKYRMNPTKIILDKFDKIFKRIKKNSYKNYIQNQLINYNILPKYLQGNIKKS